MVWQALLQSTIPPSLVLIRTPLDAIVVWGALVILLGLIVWREYTLPDTSPAMSPAGPLSPSPSLAIARPTPGSQPAVDPNDGKLPPA